MTLRPRPRGIESIVAEPTLVDEHDLGDFRRTQLSPEALLRYIEANVQVLLRLGVGVGKSHAADGLLRLPQLYERFDLVIYAAPTHAILGERPILAETEPAPVKRMLLKPRPVIRCGVYAERWSQLERARCGAYAKKILCEDCRTRDTSGSPCEWPLLYRDLKGIRLVFTTEQQLLNNRSLVPLLLARTGGRRVLVILDEAQLLDARFELALHPGELDMFRQVLEGTPTDKYLTKHRVRQLTRLIDLLLDADTSQLGDINVESTTRAAISMHKVQEAGIRMFGADFRYPGFDLVHLGWSRRGERWKDSRGGIRFIARPYLSCHVLVLSAHLTADYVGHRLGRERMASPFERARFLHSGTRVLNLRNRIGADRHFGRNHRQILDVFAVLILRNVALGRSTVLVSRKKTKDLCAEYLRLRLAEWGVRIELVTENYDQLPSRPDPRTIPLLHYGIVGVNDYAEYESAYCLNSFYVSSEVLNRQVQEFEPVLYRERLEISSGPDRTRRARIADASAGDLDRTAIGNLYLRRLEVAPPIQVVGRVRFLTRPREVVLFQMHDLERDVGACEDVTCLGGLLDALGLPRPRVIDRLVLGAAVRRLTATGLTYEQAAHQLGRSRRTAFRAVKALKSAKTPLVRILLRQCLGTLLPDLTASEDGA